jgi:hypothetical protein
MARTATQDSPTEAFELAGKAPFPTPEYLSKSLYSCSRSLRLAALPAQLRFGDPLQIGGPCDPLLRARKLVERMRGVAYAIDPAE